MSRPRDTSCLDSQNNAVLTCFITLLISYVAEREKKIETMRLIAEAQKYYALMTQSKSSEIEGSYICFNFK